MWELVCWLEQIAQRLWSQVKSSQAERADLMLSEPFLDGQPYDVFLAKLQVQKEVDLEPNLSYHRVSLTEINRIK